MSIITKEERKVLLDAVKGELVRQIVTEEGDALRLISPARVCGLMDCDRKTLDGLGIPRVTLTPGHYRYRLSDVAAWIESRRA